MLESNGFTRAFYKICWPIIEAEIIRFFSCLHNHSMPLEKLKGVAIILIPKKKVLEIVVDFRPISHFFAYLVSKVLAKRLAFIIEPCFQLIVPKRFH